MKKITVIKLIELFNIFSLKKIVKYHFDRESILCVKNTYLKSILCLFVYYLDIVGSYL